jgi:sulfatase modifying factor 1
MGSQHRLSVYGLGQH